jgi:hypothetical protein
MWRIRTRNENVTWSLLLEATVSIIRQWIHWIWKTFFYWILLSNELFAWFFEFSFDDESFDSVIWEKNDVACSHSRRENIVKMTTVIHDCECLLSCKKSCVFHARNACSSHYWSWRRFVRSTQNSLRVLCVILSEIHRKRSSFMNEKCCKS